MTAIPTRMRAMALHRFGSADALELQTLSLPTPGANEVLIQVEFAGVGAWDPFEREGGYARMLGIEPKFPYLLGSEGAGAIVGVGEQITRFRKGDRVYAAGFLNPKGGFYAEFVAVDEGLVSHVPEGVPMDQAGVIAGVGLTALRGLEDTLNVQPGESVMIFGASGGVGHVAVQLAKQMGARVFAVASGADGVELVTRLGADAAADGRKEDVLAAAQVFAPSGIDVALLTAGGEAATRALAAMRGEGRVACPGGVQLEAPANLQLQIYNGEPDADVLARLHRRIASGPFEAHIAQAFDLEAAAEAHKALEQHHLGKLALSTR